DDARIVFVAERGVLEAMALQTIDERYRAAYMALEEQERSAQLAPFIGDLNHKTYRELIALRTAAGYGIERSSEVNWPVLEQLEREALAFGEGKAGFYGAILGGDGMKDDFMPADDDPEMAARLGELCKLHGTAFAIQIKPNTERPFRVLMALYEDGRGV